MDSMALPIYRHCDILLSREDLRCFHEEASVNKRHAVSPLGCCLVFFSNLAKVVRLKEEGLSF